MKKILILLSATLLFTAGCKKNEDKNVTGTWQEEARIAKYAGVRYWVNLHEDKTFELKLMYFTDVADTQPVPCSGNRTDYVKGKYTQAGQDLTFDGTYCDSTFAISQENCKGDFSYNRTFHYIISDKYMIWDYERPDEYKIWLLKQ